MLMIQGDELKKLEKEFHRIDENKDGKLTPNEMKKGYGDLMVGGMKVKDIMI
jgi:Ca2+-binding EF-hand superfamily protein